VDESWLSPDFFPRMLNFPLRHGPCRGIQTQNDTFRKPKTHLSPDLYRFNRQRHQIPHANDIVSSRREGEDPPHRFQPAVSSLSQNTHRLHPAKDFFDAFPFPLADFIAFMPRRTSVDRATTRTLDILLLRATPVCIELLRSGCCPDRQLNIFAF
jgi:hypothetical protein